MGSRKGQAAIIGIEGTMGFRGIWQRFQLTTGPGRLAQAILLLLASYMLLFHLLVLLATVAFIRNRERGVETSLAVTTRPLSEGQIFTRFLEFTWDPLTGDVDEEAVEIYSLTEDWRNVVAALRIIQLERPINRADIITPKGELIVSADGTAPAKEVNARHLLLLERAAAGEITSTEPQGTQERFFFFPMRDDDGRTLAILRIELDNQGMLLLRRIALWMFGGLVLSLALLLVVLLLINRLIRRTIDAEKFAARSDRLRAVGTMTAGIAHEIRNPLNIIALEIEELKAVVSGLDRQEDRARIAPLVEDLRAETNRIGLLTRQFLEFSRNDTITEEGALTGTELSEVLRDTVRLWERSIPTDRRRVFLHLEHEMAGSAPISANALRQVVLNLLRNADEALGELSGVINIRTRSSAKMVFITIEDNGPGMSNEVAARAFDPFYTTRAEGTGLGLPLCRKVIETAGGTIELDTRPGGPTVLQIVLPIAGKA